MKPLDLTMKSFLGFKESTAVDFRPLYEDKIFLVTGPTGAGKTSIFDAICYALYGEGSGSTRTKAKCFRSQLADDKEDMEVSLSFEVKGELYHVRRVETPKGVNKAYFYRESDPEKMLVKIKEVNQEIEGIIGLNLDQFKKIVMIPQGEFREFLTAGTKDKSEILKKLFSTEQYERLQWRIKEKFDDTRSIDKTLVLKFNEILKEAGMEGQDIEMGPDALLESLQAAEEETENLEKEIEVLEKKGKEIEKEIADSEKNNSELAVFQKASDEYDRYRGLKRVYEEKDKELKLLRKISAITHTEKQLADKEKDIRKLQSDLKVLEEDRKKVIGYMDRCRKSLHDATEEAKELDEKKTEKNRLQNLLVRSKRLGEAHATLNELRLKGQEIEKKLSHLRKKETELKGYMEEEHDASGELQEAKVKQMELKLKLQESNSRLKTLVTLFNKAQKRDEIESNIRLFRKEEENIARNIEVATNAYEHELAKRNENYAHILRSQLHDNEPCPVCGSYEHPSATKEARSFDEELISTLEEKKKLLEKSLQEKKSDIRNGIRHYEDLAEEIIVLGDESEISIFKVDDLRIVGGDEKEKYRRLENKLAENMTIVNKYTTKLDGIQVRSELCRKELAVMDDLMKVYDENNARLHDLQGEIRSLMTDGVPKESLGLIHQIKEIDRIIEEISKRLDEAKKNFEECQNQDQNLRGQESALNQTLISSLEAAKSLKDQFFTSLLEADVTRDAYEMNKHKVPDTDSIEEEITTFFKGYNAVKGVYESLREHGESLRFKEVDPLKSRLDESMKELKEKNQQYKEKEILVYNLKRSHVRLGEIHESYLLNQKNLTVLQDLYDTANLGMGFETFVQSYYFEGILLRANERLRKMSEGRYKLKRRNETENRREKIGLGLDVFDEYTGRERDVQSLSGGESFKASLSLALGLSDFIESHKGSVNLETIFIDEGFGSLDQDSLDNALESLMELNVSGRIVGIISHVTELKDRIPGKIEVKSIPGKGSTIKVNGGI
ncbi:AAA family ATPase [Proteiniclasticum sp. C24MP]|uniref:AAA family ATPase n=1 Tax=Proteiniclasticum sp. C24MP TaxID=3374101 RepID=UPI0037540538